MSAESSQDGESSGIAEQLRRKNEKARAKRASETPEQREERLAKRRRQDAQKRLLAAGASSHQSDDTTTEEEVQDCALAVRTPQSSGDDWVYGPGFTKEGDFGAVVGACAACGYPLTTLPVPGVATQTEMKQEASQTPALMRTRSTQTCNL
ncbi:hypothetical protein V5799_027572 [Amblyomma americanum]|uniref:Uncharacterized protein n=1 Tax=Amblyomma americanum TaxID=6943 RepID=A0AAQ4DFB7_AMBAM